MNTISLLDTIGQGLRYGMRILRNTPTFALVVILALALAPAPTRRFFSSSTALRLRSLPVEQPNQLVSIGIDQHGKGWVGRGSPGPRDFHRAPVAGVKQRGAHGTDSACGPANKRRKLCCCEPDLPPQGLGENRAARRPPSPPTPCRAVDPIDHELVGLLDGKRAETERVDELKNRRVGAGASARARITTSANVGCCAGSACRSGGPARSCQQRDGVHFGDLLPAPCSFTDASIEQLHRTVRVLRVARIVGDHATPSPRRDAARATAPSRPRRWSSRGSPSAASASRIAGSPTTARATRDPLFAGRPIAGPENASPYATCRPARALPAIAASGSAPAMPR